MAQARFQATPVTYGLMQVKSPSPLGDRDSIDHAFGHTVQLSRPFTEETGPVSLFSVAAQLCSYKDSPRFRRS